MALTLSNFPSWSLLDHHVERHVSPNVDFQAYCLEFAGAGGGHGSPFFYKLSSQPGVHLWISFILAFVRAGQLVLTPNIQSLIKIPSGI